MVNAPQKNRLAAPTGRFVVASLLSTTDHVPELPSRNFALQLRQLLRINLRRKHLPAAPTRFTAANVYAPSPAQYLPPPSRLPPHQLRQPRNLLRRLSHAPHRKHRRTAHASPTSSSLFLFIAVLAPFPQQTDRSPQIVTLSIPDSSLGPRRPSIMSARNQGDDLAMHYRKFGRTGWDVSEIGYGMWDLPAGPGPTTPNRSTPCNAPSISAAISSTPRGPTARPQRAESSEKFCAPTKIISVLAGRTKNFTSHENSAKNLQWPSRRDFTLDDCYPPDHIEAYVNKSLANLRVEKLDLIQFHTWEDRCSTTNASRALWKSCAPAQSRSRRRQRQSLGAVQRHSRRARRRRRRCPGHLQHFRPESRRRALSICRMKNVAVIARVPFDEEHSPAL